MNTCPIITDTQNKSMVGAYGQPAMDTPRVDWPVGMGIRAGQAGTSCPLCTLRAVSCSRATIHRSNDQADRRSPAHHRTFYHGSERRPHPAGLPFQAASIEADGTWSKTNGRERYVATE